MPWSNKDWRPYSGGCIHDQPPLGVGLYSFRVDGRRWEGGADQWLHPEVACAREGRAVNGGLSSRLEKTALIASFEFLDIDQEPTEQPIVKGGDFILQSTQDFFPPAIPEDFGFANVDPWTHIEFLRL